MVQQTIDETTVRADGKSRRGVRLTVALLAVAALAVYLSTFLQILLMK